jgi:aminoglycoside 6'-N-acetyltransferase
MRLDDLELVAGWLLEPHVARWYSTRDADNELGQIRRGVLGEVPTHLLIVEEGGRPIGWCQWYLLGESPDYANDVGARRGDAGIDYAVGDVTRVGCGVGTLLIALLIELVRDHHRGAGIVVDPDARNVASRRILEKNGFSLVDVRVVPTGEADAPMAIYRLD